VAVLVTPEAALVKPEEVPATAVPRSPETPVIVVVALTAWLGLYGATPAGKFALAIHLLVGEGT
jgi:hypothetical protein